MERQLIYRDEVYEAKTRIDLEVSRKALQLLLDEWNKQDLIPCTDYFTLVYSTQKVYSDAVKSVAEIPIAVGKFKVSKDAFMSILEVPVPNELYVLAKKAKDTPYVGYKDLWSIRDNKVIDMDQKVADSIIFAKNVYAENEIQRDFALDIIKFVELGAKIDSVLGNLPGTLSTFGVPWTLVGRRFPGLFVVSLEPEQLRALLKAL